VHWEGGRGVSGCGVGGLGEGVKGRGDERCCCRCYISGGWDPSGGLWSCRREYRGTSTPRSLQGGGEGCQFSSTRPNMPVSKVRLGELRNLHVPKGLQSRMLFVHPPPIVAARERRSPEGSHKWATVSISW